MDFLIALGPLSSNHVGHRGELPKPVIAPFIDNPALQGIPLKDGTSGKKNLSYVNCETDPIEEVKRFLEITPFRHLAFLISRALYEELPQGVLAMGLQREGIDVEVLPVVVDASAAEALAAIP